MTISIVKLNDLQVISTYDFLEIIYTYIRIETLLTSHY